MSFKKENRKRVLVTDAVHPILLEGLEKQNFDVTYLPKISLSQVKEMIAPYVGIIINSKIIMDKTMMEAAPHLKFIARLGSGMEIVDQAYAAQRGIAVHSAPEGNCNAVGEHAVGMLFALANKLLKADREVRQMKWDRESCRGYEIAGKTLGIIGFGHTGSHFAKKMQGMDIRILAYDKYKSGYADKLSYVQESTLENLFEQADIISLHLPLTPETYHFVEDAFIEKMQNPFIIINTSRGTCLSTSALLKGLKTKKIIGACLDVFENEKPPSFSSQEKEMYSQLYSLPQVILSPHVAGWTVESKQRLAEILLHKISNS